MNSRVALLCTCVVYVTLVQGQLPNRSPDSRYQYSTDMDQEGKYVLRWGFNSSDIWFEAQVQTLGFVGFGISQSGRMFPADVVVGWIANEQAYFRDYHTERYGHPNGNETTDWFGDYGYEENGWTVLGFHRALDTCDTVGDIKIDKTTMKLIYSYDPVDPDANSATPLFHHDYRGSKSVSLLNPSPVSFPPDADVIDFTNENFTIPSDRESSYHCRVFDLSAVPDKYHIIKAAAVYSPGTETFVEYMALYRCRHPDPASILAAGSSFNCFSDAPDHVQFCREHVASFGHGQKDFFLPEDMGIPIGGPEEANVYVLATHYQNDGFETGIVDNSGIQLTYTAMLRPNDAAFLSMGNIISPNWLQFLPPGESSFTQKAYCSERCLGWGFRGSGNAIPMTIVGAQFHVHGLGKAMKLRHFSRTGGQSFAENPWLVHDDHFDARQQTFNFADQRRNVSYFDHMLLECTYDTNERSGPTFGGWNIRDELCRAYVLYYPRKSIEGCMSWSNYDQLRSTNGTRIPGNQVFQTLINTDWTGNNVMRRNLRSSLDESIENAQCWSSKQQPSYAIDWMPRTEKQPSSLYTPPADSTCRV
ncbi:DBH-like monooxygenase protein 1 [Mya arenaria]|uniref:DBH-like monooxygenase protein 1 n=1 Tax=Mya arenaria TaxID=6604 RepID=UPI0022E7A17B|nr:DBH-like monooxygenase protein 1 [Mya arenaria]